MFLQTLQIIHATVSAGEHILRVNSHWMNTTDPPDPSLPGMSTQGTDDNSHSTETDASCLF